MKFLLRWKAVKSNIARANHNWSPAREHSNTSQDGTSVQENQLNCVIKEREKGTLSDLPNHCKEESQRGPEITIYTSNEAAYPIAPNKNLPSAASRPLPHLTLELRHVCGCLYPRQCPCWKGVCSFEPTDVGRCIPARPDNPSTEDGGGWRLGLGHSWECK